MRRTSTIALAILAGVCSPPLLETSPRLCRASERPAGQVVPTEKIDAYITQRMRARRIPGLALAVVEDGKLALERAYGTADLVSDAPVKTNSIFQVASITKQFTAAAILMLVEGGKVRLDDPIGSYINGAPVTWAKITVRHLLTHTSGILPGAIIRVDDQGNLTTREGTPLMDITAKRALEVIGRAPLLFPAGDRIMYCDAGYFLLGLVIEKVAGESYQDFMQRRFFQPLQMGDSSVLDKWKIVKNSVPVYSLRDGQISPWRRDWQYEVNAFAGICSTVEDLAKWDAALRARRLLKQTSFDLMWTPAKLNDGQEAVLFGDAYGFGWTLGELRGHRTVEHAGASGTFILRFLDDRLTVIVLTNLDGPSGSQPGELARGIAGLLRAQYQPPDMLIPQGDPSPQTTSRIKALLSDLAEGREPAGMTAAHRAFYDSLPRPIRQENERVLKSLRLLTYIASDDVAGRGLKRLGEPVSRIIYYKADLEGKTFYFTFWMTAEGRVAFLRFHSV